MFTPVNSLAKLKRFNELTPAHFEKAPPALV